MCSDGPEEQPPSIYETKLVELSEQDHEYWKRSFKPVEDAAIAAAHEAGSDAEVNRVRGQAHLAAMSGMRLGGGDPNSGNFVRSNAGMGIQVGKASADAASNAELTAKKTKYNKLANLAFFGRGQRAIADSNLRAVAGYQAGHDALEATSQTNANSMNMELLGEVAGMGLSYGSKSGWFGGADPDAADLAMNTTNFNNGYNPNLVKPGQALV